MCEVHLQYRNSTTKWPFYTFSIKFPSNIYSILYDFCLEHIETFRNLQLKTSKYTIFFRFVNISDLKIVFELHFCSCSRSKRQKIKPF